MFFPEKRKINQPISDKLGCDHWFPSQYQKLVEMFLLRIYEVKRWPPIFP